MTGASNSILTTLDQKLKMNPNIAYSNGGTDSVARTSMPGQEMLPRFSKNKSDNEANAKE